MQLPVHYLAERTVSLGAGFLEGKEPQALIRGMVAVRAYPAAAIAVEGELFWRIPQESLEMAQAFERDLRLPEGQTMVGGC